MRNLWERRVEEGSVRAEESVQAPREDALHEKVNRE